MARCPQSIRESKASLVALDACRCQGIGCQQSGAVPSCTPSSWSKRAAFKTHVCLQPKGRTSPRQTDGRLLPSSTEAVEALLARLKCSRQALDEWTDRLREWFASHVLQPLARLLDTAHLVCPARS